MKLRNIPIPDAPDREGNAFDRSVKERLETALPLHLPSYTVQQLRELTPSFYQDVMVKCSNGDAGAECLAFCNGRAWFVVSFGDRISMT